MPGFMVTTKTHEGSYRFLKSLLREKSEELKLQGNENDVRYTFTHLGVERKGRSLARSANLLAALNLPPKFAEGDVDMSNMTKDLVFVTYNSANHFLEAIDAIATVQALFPGHKILYYDLGLDEEQIKQVSIFRYLSSSVYQMKNALLCTIPTCYFRWRAGAAWSTDTSTSLSILLMSELWEIMLSSL